jgi:hypothetical protein
VGELLAGPESHAAPWNIFLQSDLSPQDGMGNISGSWSAAIICCSRGLAPQAPPTLSTGPCLRRRAPMNCLVCGNQMRLALVEPHDEVRMPGFEYRTFQCERCGDRERRFVFDPRPSVDPSSLAPSM